MRFRFRLEAVWRCRRAREEALRLGLAALRARRDLLRRRAEARRRMWGGLRSAEAWLLEALQGSMERDREARRELEGEIAAQLQQLAAARRQREALDRLRARARREFRRIRRQREGHELDEIAVRGWSRRRAEGGP